MITALHSVTTPPETEILRRYRFTVSDLQRMAEAGILGGDQRVELLDGEIIEMMTPGPPHASIVDVLMEHFSALPETYKSQCVVRVQNPIHLDDTNQPQPDVALARQSADRYRKSHPTAADVLLLVEVSDTTLRKDREVKVPLYARAGVAEVWVVDVVRQAVIVHRRPTSEGHYAYMVEYRPGDRLAPERFAGHELEVAALFG